MTARTLPAASIPVRAVVRLGEGRVEVAHIVNGDPLPGWLTLTDTAGHHWHLGGSERVSVVSLP